MAKNIVETVTGDLSEKKRYRAIQKRAHDLPGDYRIAYDEIQKYLWATGGTERIEPFESLVELFEEGAAQGRPVLEITGEDVAAFADQLVYGERGYIEKRREKLNRTLAEKLGKGSE
ncbi:MAG: DUF1048 domain-containing protein [Coriobacteriia bacterium]|nr:DUF1048 domain-containing protein [Coriobacteriia bacterium]